MSRESEFFRAVAARDVVRVRVAAIVIDAGRLLVQRPTDDPDACYAFIGGEYERGDTFASRIAKEFEEETNARVVRCEYLFVAENSFIVDGATIQSLEHFFQVELDRTDLVSREPHMSQHWLPLERLTDYDVRPHSVRNVIAEGDFRTVRWIGGGDIAR